MYKFLKNAGLALLVILITYGIYFRFIGKGIPATHDGPMHLVRMVNYYLALQQGQFPPRLGPNLANGLGYPVFNFNYPLANIISVPFFKLHLDYEIVFQAVTFCLLIIGSFGTVILTRSYLKSNYLILLGLIMFLTSPYLIQLVFVRGGIGELAATALLPFLLWAIRKLSLSPNFKNSLILGLLGGLYLLSHNMLVWLSILPLGLFTLMAVIPNKRFIKSSLVSVIIAVGLSAFFWVPALSEKSFTILDDAPMSLDYIDHFLYPHQLFSGAWGYGFSKIGPVDGLSFRFSVAEIAGLILAFVLTFKNRFRYMLWLIFIISVFLSLSPSEFIWKLLPGGNFIQFPWRALWISHFAAVIIIVDCLKRQSYFNKSLVIFLSLVAIGESLYLTKPYERVLRSQESWLRSGETTSTMNENSPKGFNINTAYEVSEKIFMDKLVYTENEQADINILSWDGSNHEYTVNTASMVYVTERTANFPGWETKADSNKLTYVPDPWNAGLISYKLDPGQYRMNTKFTQNTRPRLMGNSISFLTLVLITTALLFEFLKTIRVKVNP